MGIHDRDYIRETRGGGGVGAAASRGFGALGMWSVNTWLIVICVAVFVIDGFTPRQYWKPVEVSRNVPPDVEISGGSQYRIVRAANEDVVLQRIGQAQRLVVDVTTSPPTQVGTVTYALMPPLQRWLYFSTNRAFQNLEVWRFIGFQFLHGGFGHLLFNMIGLYFFGPLVERYLGSKRYLAFYLLCGICGALMYLLLNLGGYISALTFGQDVSIPGLLFNSTVTPLIGASAGVFGVLMAGAYLVPNAMVLLFFILPMRLKTVAYGLVALALFTLIMGGNNAGGEAGHLGGAIAGFYFIRRPHHLHGFFDLLGRADPTSHHYRHPTTGRPARPSASQREIDRILDKINDQGIQSLTEEEKRILREASRR